MTQEQANKKVKYIKKTIKEHRVKGDDYTDVQLARVIDMNKATMYKRFKEGWKKSELALIELIDMKDIINNNLH